jgi:predicted transcriptional regulator
MSGENYMTAIKKISKNKVIVKTGTVEDFFSTVESVMRSADKGEKLIPKSKTLIFENPMEMLHFLSTAKITLINRIRQRPDTIKNLAKDIHRKESSVLRDINELENVGLVKSYKVINPGHGIRKIVELTASELKLEASI